MAMNQLGHTVTSVRLVIFVLTLAIGLAIMYAILLTFAALVFWTPFLFTWLFDSLYRLARYPVGLYPGWLRLILTWIVPVGVMTTVPAQALTGTLSATMLVASVTLATALLVGSSLLFRLGLRRYASASS